MRELEPESVLQAIWEFPRKFGVPYLALFLGGPYCKDPTISGTILGPPIFGNPRMCPEPEGLRSKIGLG